MRIWKQLLEEQKRHANTSGIKYSGHYNSLISPLNYCSNREMVLEWNVVEVMVVLYLLVVLFFSISSITVK